MNFKELAFQVSTKLNIPLWNEDESENDFMVRAILEYSAYRDKQRHGDSEIDIFIHTEKYFKEWNERFTIFVHNGSVSTFDKSLPETILMAILL